MILLQITLKIKRMLYVHGNAAGVAGKNLVGSWTTKRVESFILNHDFPR